MAELEKTIAETIKDIFNSPSNPEDFDSWNLHIAISVKIPKVGEKCNCKHLKKKSKTILYFCNIETDVLKNVIRIANNMYIAATENSCYIIRILDEYSENVYLSMVYKEPECGTTMKCYKLEYVNSAIELIPSRTSTIQKVDFINGIYVVITKNSTYFCLQM